MTDITNAIETTINKFADNYKYVSSTNNEKQKTNLELFNYLKVVCQKEYVLPYYRMYHQLRKGD